MKEYILKETIPLDLRTFFDAFLADSSAVGVHGDGSVIDTSESHSALAADAVENRTTFFEKYYKSLGYSGLLMCEWIPDDENSASRVCCYSLNSDRTSPSSPDQDGNESSSKSGNGDDRCTERQTFILHLSQEGLEKGKSASYDAAHLGAQCLTLHCVTTPMAPGGNNFHIESKWMIRPVVEQTDLTLYVNGDDDTVLQNTKMSGSSEYGGANSALSSAASSDGGSSSMVTATPALEVEIHGTVECHVDLWGIQSFAERMILQRAHIAVKGLLSAMSARASELAVQRNIMLADMMIRAQKQHSRFLTSGSQQHQPLYAKKNRRSRRREKSSASKATRMAGNDDHRQQRNGKESTPLSAASWMKQGRAGVGGTAKLFDRMRTAPAGNQHLLPSLAEDVSSRNVLAATAPHGDRREDHTVVYMDPMGNRIDEDANDAFMPILDMQDRSNRRRTKHGRKSQGRSKRKSNGRQHGTTFATKHHERSMIPSTRFSQICQKFFSWQILSLFMVLIILFSILLYIALFASQIPFWR